MNLNKYLENIGTTVSQTVGVIFRGDPDETISSRMGKNLDSCVVCKLLCKFLDLIDKDHCKKAAIRDQDEGKDAV